MPPRFQTSFCLWPTLWLELGYYLLVIDDEPEKAAGKFDRSIELALRQLINIVIVVILTNGDVTRDL